MTFLYLSNFGIAINISAEFRSVQLGSRCKDRILSFASFAIDIQKLEADSVPRKKKRHLGFEEAYSMAKEAKD